MKILKAITLYVGALVLIWACVKQADAALFGIWQVGADETDGSGRSGLGLRIDAGTGCHYLVSPWGGITPRLGNDGKQICK